MSSATYSRSLIAGDAVKVSETIALDNTISKLVYTAPTKGYAKVTFLIGRGIGRTGTPLAAKRYLQLIVGDSASDTDRLLTTYAFFAGTVNHTVTTLNVEEFGSVNSAWTDYTSLIPHNMTLWVAYDVIIPSGKKVYLKTYDHNDAGLAQPNYYAIIGQEFVNG